MNELLTALSRKDVQSETTSQRQQVVDFLMQVKASVDTDGFLGVHLKGSCIIILAIVMCNSVPASELKA